MKNALAAICLVLLAAAGLAAAGVRPAFGGEEKITICHASGQAGTTKFETLTISPNAVFGPGGHFNENGTPQAGHEQDYMGACRTDTTTTDTTTETTTTGTTTTDTTTQTTTTETQPPSDCPPGMIHDRGHDGNAGNDDCCFPGVNCDGDTTTTDTQPPVTTTVPPATTEPGTTTTTIEPTTAETTTEQGAASPPPVKQTPPKKHPKPAKAGPKKMPPVCPVGKPANSPFEPCAVQGSG